MQEAVRVITEQAEIESFLGALGEDQSPAARTSFWQLHDFAFERIICFSDDIHLGKDESMTSDTWLASQGIDSDDSPKTLLLVEGNVVSEGHIRLEYAIVRGDVTCKSLFVHGEALFVCLGTCTAQYIESSYNGVISCIQRAIADFVFLSTDEVLAIHQIEPGAVLLAHWDSEIVENMFLPGLIVDDEFTEECKGKIANGETVLRLDCRAILQHSDRLGTDAVGAAHVLASIAGIETFRFWDDTRPLATVLHALAEVEASETEILNAIQILVGAGVPLEQEGKKLRFGKGVGTALHVAIVLGKTNAARAFAGAGADVNVGGGRLLKLVLYPLEYMAEYPERSSAEEKRELIDRARISMALATELNYRPIDELRTVGERTLTAIEEAKGKGKNRL